MKSTVGCLAAVLLSASVLACSGDEDAPGPGGTSSSSSGAASSSGGTSSSGDAGEAGGLLNTGAIGCNADTDCRSGHCFMGNMQHFCTLACTTDNATQVCEAPLTGTCNKQGYCKRD